MTTIEEAQRYPLTWPAGKPRRPASARVRGRFYGYKQAQTQTRADGSTYTTGGGKRDITLAEAAARVGDELRKLGADNIILSTNVVLNRDGSVRSGLRDPEDPGAAVWFEWGLKPYVFACDTYTRVADNVAALAAHIDSVRTSERHGVAGLEQSFTGFLALPAHRMGRWTGWRDAFGTEGTPGNMTPQQKWAHVEKRHREMIIEMRRERPDGTHPDEAELNALRDEARRELDEACAKGRPA